MSGFTETVHHSDDPDSSCDQQLNTQYLEEFIKIVPREQKIQKNKYSNNYYEGNRREEPGLGESVIVISKRRAVGIALNSPGWLRAILPGR